MNQILIATHNKAKFKEISHYLQANLEKNIKIVSLTDLNISNEPEETGKTFEENAKLKAEYYATLSGLPTISDDAGLVIPYLNNEPGVKSRRWLGRESTDDELIQHALARLKGVPREKRVAYLEVCIYFFNPHTKQHFFEKEKKYGHIAEKALVDYTAGYPFRAVLVLDEFNKYYEQLTHEEHEQMNHRFIALKRLCPKIKKDLLQ